MEAKNYNVSLDTIRNLRSFLDKMFGLNYDQMLRFNQLHYDLSWYRFIYFCNTGVYPYVANVN